MDIDDILELAQNGSDREKYFLFTKILENSTDVLNSLSIFSKVDKEKLVLHYNPPKFNHHFFDKRHKILKK
ncbi:MAG: hypothetical protein D3923_01335 [Candidatus Electrothrix sp. AR3]|nr:hypothetical protein [Candidatus Electrothrix sp. AR3]